MRKKPAFIVTVVALVTLTVMLSSGSVYAQTLVLTPNPVTQGVSVQVTGTEFEPSENGQIQVYTFNAGSCAPMPLMNLDVSTDGSGNLEPVNITTSGLSPGTYCVEANGFLSSPDPVNLIVNPATATITAQASSEPGYLYGLPLLLGAIGVVYAVMSRRNQK